MPRGQLILQYNYTCTSNARHFFFNCILCSFGMLSNQSTSTYHLHLRIKRHLIRSLWSYFNQNFDPFACIIVCGSLFPVPLDSPLNFFVHTMQLLHSNHFTPSLRAHNVHLNFMPINHTYHSYCVYGQVYMLYGLSTYIILSYQIFSTMYSTPTILHPPNGMYITCHN